MPQGPGGTPSGTSDEDDVDRRLREISQDIARQARFREPSAAERASKGVQPAARRESRKARKLREPLPEPGRRLATQAPAGPSASPWRAASPASAHRSSHSVLAVIVVVAVLGAGIAAAGWLSRHHLPGSPAIPKAITSGPVPSQAPTASASEPFLGSPAAAYADGSAGIVVPAVRKAVGFSAAQVAGAYLTTRKLLTAAFLNQPTLRGRSPVAFANLLTAQQRKSFVSGLDKMGLDQRGFLRSTRGWIASFAPGSAAFAGTVIKVHGRMSAGVAAISGGRHVLRVRADYLFVYPVMSPGQPGTLMRIVRRLAVDVDFAQWDDPGGHLEPWWGTFSGGTAGARCDINDGFIHPDYAQSAPERVKPTGTPVDPYDQSIPPSGPGCHSVTGT
jgi:hypothetical protein